MLALQQQRDKSVVHDCSADLASEHFGRVVALDEGRHHADVAAVHRRCRLFLLELVEERRRVNGVVALQRCSAHRELVATVFCCR